MEWLNVSGGGDGAVDSVYLSPELERAGFAWVGISAQQVGIDNLRQKDPARYGSLMDPGDQYPTTSTRRPPAPCSSVATGILWPHCTPSGCWRWVSPSRRCT